MWIWASTNQYDENDEMTDIMTEGFVCSCLLQNMSEWNRRSCGDCGEFLDTWGTWDLCALGLDLWVWYGLIFEWLVWKVDIVDLLKTMAGVEDKASIAMAKREIQLFPAWMLSIGRWCVVRIFETGNRSENRVNTLCHTDLIDMLCLLSSEKLLNIWIFPGITLAIILHRSPNLMQKHRIQYPNPIKNRWNSSFADLAEVGTAASSSQPGSVPYESHSWCANQQFSNLSHSFIQVGW